MNGHEVSLTRGRYAEYNGIPIKVLPGAGGCVRGLVV